LARTSLIIRFARGTGLFTADQQLGDNRPFYTRQNAHGTFYGYEIPEERDYFPYWGPTPWKDIAIMVSDKKTEDLMREYVNGTHYGHKCESFLSCQYDCLLLPLFSLLLLFSVLLHFVVSKLFVAS